LNKTLGIVAHSFEGGTLCFLTACREGTVHLGPHMHPEIVVSAIPMGLTLDAWETDDHQAVGRELARGVQQVADAGAAFYLCPDNTAHIVLEKIASELPIPGLHIAHAVREEIVSHGWKRIGLLGTKWTMTGTVYPAALGDAGLECLAPDEPTMDRLQAAIFDELCQSIFRPETTELFVQAIRDLEAKGAECAILGCTEIPLIINDENSPLPVLDTTRLQAQYAVAEALAERPIAVEAGWLETVDRERIVAEAESSG